MPLTSAPNLFAAAKAYLLAMERLLADTGPGRSEALAMPYFLLAGFALELSLKAVILLVGGDQRQLLDLGHRLREAHQVASNLGMEADPTGDLRHLVDKMHDPHRGMLARYVPDLEIIALPHPSLVFEVLAAHLQRIENQYQIWDGVPPAAPCPPALNP